MTNREALENLSRIDDEIAELEKLIAKERSDVDSLSRRLTKIAADRRKEKDRVLIAISRIESSLYRKVLIAFYVNRRSVISIAQEIHYSESRTYEIIKEREGRLKL